MNLANMLTLRPQTAMRTRRGHMTCGCQGSPSKGPARATRGVASDPTASVLNALPRERTDNALPGVVSLLRLLGSGLSKTAQNGHRNVVKVNKNNKLTEPNHNHTRAKPNRIKLKERRHQTKAKQGIDR